MKVKLAEQTVVVVANDVNISIFKPWWLIANGIVQESEVISDNVVISPVAIHIPTVGFELGIFPNRIQMVFYPNSDNIQESINRIMGQIIQKLPHTPYTGIGLNYNYLLSLEKSNFYSWTKKNLSSDFTNSITIDDNSKPKYGSYLSFDFLDGRLKLDVKPVTGNDQISSVDSDWLQGKDLIRANFNFHYDINVQRNSIENMLNILKLWVKNLAKADEIINKLSE